MTDEKDKKKNRNEQKSRNKRIKNRQTTPTNYITYKMYIIKNDNHNN